MGSVPDGIAPYGVAAQERRFLESALVTWKVDGTPEDAETLEVAIRDLLDALKDHDERTLGKG